MYYLGTYSVLSLCTVAENTVWGCLLRGGLSTTGGKINRSSETRLCNKFLLSFDLDETHKCYRCGGEIWTKWCYLGTCQVICQTPGEAFEALPWAKPWYNKEDWSVNKVGDRQPKTQGTRNFYFHFFLVIRITTDVKDGGFYWATVQLTTASCRYPRVMYAMLRFPNADVVQVSPRDYQLHTPPSWRIYEGLCGVTQ